MNLKKLDVMLLIDLTHPADGPDFEHYITGPDWATESDVLHALRENGHVVQVVGLFDKVEPLLKSVSEHRPDIIFNLVEHFRNDTSLERDVVGLIELLGIPYTGTGPTGLSLCKNKGLMKKLMTFHKIKTPKFGILNRNKPVHRPTHLRFPIIIKPTREDASYGISQASFVESDGALEERVKYVHQSLNQDALIEEYIEGRELYLSVIGNDRVKVLSPRELVFKEVPDDEPKIATFKAKWDEEYRKKWGIQNRFANPIGEGVYKHLIQVCKRVVRILMIKGYGRIDLRLTPAGDIMILEANPNPGISKEEELPLSAEKDGLAYNALIQKILHFGLQLHEAHR